MSMKTWAWRLILFPQTHLMNMCQLSPDHHFTISISPLYHTVISSHTWQGKCTPTTTTTTTTTMVTTITTTTTTTIRTHTQHHHRRCHQKHHDHDHDDHTHRHQEMRGARYTECGGGGMACAKGGLHGVLLL